MPVLSINGTGMQLRPPGAPLGIALEARYDQDEVILCLATRCFCSARADQRSQYTRRDVRERTTDDRSGKAGGWRAAGRRITSAALKDFTAETWQSDLTLIMLERSAGDGSRDRSR